MARKDGLRGVNMNRNRVLSLGLNIVNRVVKLKTLDKYSRDPLKSVFIVPDKAEPGTRYKIRINSGNNKWHNYVLLDLKINGSALDGTSRAFFQQYRTAWKPKYDFPIQFGDDYYGVWFGYAGHNYFIEGPFKPTAASRRFVLKHHLEGRGDGNSRGSLAMPMPMSPLSGGVFMP